MKTPRNFRNLSEEKIERSRGKKRENFNEGRRKAKRNGATDKTLIYNGWLSGLSGNVFLHINTCIAANFPFVNGRCHFSERSLPFETVDAIYNGLLHTSLQRKLKETN